MENLPTTTIGLIVVIALAVAMYTIGRIDYKRKTAYARICRAHNFGVPDPNPCPKCGAYTDFTPNKS